jgi:hypothetical protein
MSGQGLAAERRSLEPAALEQAVSSGAVERYEKLGRIGEGTYGVVRRDARRERARRSLTALRRRFIEPATE